jgi:hypothetical protein|tara:strand:- start:176 stop:403 length:228 start_codon:yes stop_codon:yes gene_type:complete
MSKININGVIRNLTAEEQADYDKNKTIALQALEDEKAEKIKKDADAKTGNAKLLGLGLTQDEATALTGYVPPVEE